MDHITNRAAIRGQPWFDDGNIILQAECTQFRVYRGILSDSSQIFADMFFVPQTSASTELLDGCPIIHVSDTADDWRPVLETLYQRSNFRFEVDRRGLPFSTVAAFLRLGHKYEMRFLCAEATERLAYEFPSTLKRWDAVQKTSTLVTEIGPMCNVLALAQAIDTPKLDHIIPAVFYLCCQQNDFKKIFGDFESQRGDYTVEDQKAFILGWDSLVRKQAEWTFSWLSSRNPHGDNLIIVCSHKDACNRARQTLQRELFLPMTKCQALSPWKSTWERHMCGNCISAAQRSHEAGRQRIWDELPTFFGLPGWDKLLEVDGQTAPVDD